MKKFIENNDLILMEAGIADPLRRVYQVELHPFLESSSAVFCDKGRKALKEIRKNYIDVAQKANLPILILTSTSSADLNRVKSAPGMENVNTEAVNLMKELRAEYGEWDKNIKIGGELTSKNNAYDPKQGLSELESENYHAWQIQQLVEAGVDFIYPSTLPTLEESLGISRAISKTKTSYIISFVINRHGVLLDGTALVDAVKKIDQEIQNPPLGYMVNCSYPTFLCADKQPNFLFKRLIGIQANASSLDHSELDNSETRQAESVSAWGDKMIHLHKNFGLKILGGCCGTRKEHLEYLSQTMNDHIG